MRVGRPRASAPIPGSRTNRYKSNELRGVICLQAQLKSRVGARLALLLFVFFFIIISSDFENKKKKNPKIGTPVRLIAVNRTVFCFTIANDKKKKRTLT